MSSSYLNSHPSMPMSKHPANMDPLHCIYPTGIPPASLHASGDMPHPPPIMSAHFPPFFSHCIFSIAGGMTKLARKISARIAKTIKTTNDFLKCSSLIKSVPNYSLFTFGGRKLDAWLLYVKMTMRALWCIIIIFQTAVLACLHADSRILGHKNPRSAKIDNCRRSGMRDVK